VSLKIQPNQPTLKAHPEPVGFFMANGHSKRPFRRFQTLVIACEKYPFWLFPMRILGLQKYLNRFYSQ